MKKKESESREQIYIQCKFNTRNIVLQLAMSIKRLQNEEVPQQRSIWRHSIVAATAQSTRKSTEASHPRH